MGILKIIFWLLAVLVFGIFAYANWHPVPVHVWPNEILDAKLPALLLIAYLVGAVPFWIAHRASRWSLRRKLDTSERQLSDARAATASAPASVSSAASAVPTPNSPTVPLDIP